MGERKYHYDYLRIICVIGIIGIHTTDIVTNSYEKMSNYWWIGIVMQVVFRICLPIFFMLSGALILEREIISIKSFYEKRLLRILIPLFIYSLIYLFVYKYRFEILSVGNMTEALKTILAGPIHYHLWFVYTLVGLYIVAPFIQAMLKNLTDKNLWCLLLIIFMFRVAQNYLVPIGVSINIGQFIFDGWIMYFILGYAINRLNFTKYYRVICTGACISFIITLINLAFFDKLTGNIYDLSPTMILMCIGVFVFFEKNKDVFKKRLSIWKCVKKIETQSYSIYLIHAFVLSNIVNGKLGISALTVNPIVGTVITMGLTFTGSYILSFMIDFVLCKPIYLIIDKIGRKLKIVKTEKVYNIL